MISSLSGILIKGERRDRKVYKSISDSENPLCRVDCETFAFSGSPVKPDWSVRKFLLSIGASCIPLWLFCIENFKIITEDITPSYKISFS